MDCVCLKDLSKIMVFSESGAKSHLQILVGIQTRLKLVLFSFEDIA